jgi:hypothetical protein
MLLGDGRAAVAAVFAPLEARVIKAVVFDVGETLEDETREYGGVEVRHLQGRRLVT